MLSISFSFVFCREGESGSWNRSVETHSNATSQYIDGLNPYTVYLFRVAAENALGYSKPGKESYPTLTHRERESYFSAGKFPSSVFNLYFATHVPRQYFATKYRLKLILWDYHCATFMAQKSLDIQSANGAACFLY